MKYQACICFLQGPVSEAVTEKTSRKTDTSQTRAAAAVSVRKQTNEEKTNTSDMKSNPSIQTNFQKTLSKTSSSKATEVLEVDNKVDNSASKTVAATSVDHEDDSFFILRSVINW